MARYIVTSAITSSVTTEVEANSPEEAKDIALTQRSVQSICHHCTNQHDAESEWVLDGGLSDWVDESNDVIEVREINDA